MSDELQLDFLGRNFAEEEDEKSVTLENEDQLDVIYCLLCEHVLSVERVSTHTCARQLPPVGSLDGPGRSLPSSRTTSSPGAKVRRTSGLLKNTLKAKFKDATRWASKGPENLFPNIHYSFFNAELETPDGAKLRRLLEEFEGKLESGLEDGSITAADAGEQSRKFISRIMQRLRGERTSEEREGVRECLEKHICERLYNFAFSKSSVQDDVSTFVHLSSLQFLSPVDWIRAQDKLLDLNFVKSPRDKIQLVVECCKFIWKSIKTDNASVDDFLPLLIFLVLKANVPYLVSNVNFIESFRGEHDANGEASYYFVSFSSAVSFLRNLQDCDNLSIDPQKFRGRLKKWASDNIGFGSLISRSDMFHSKSKSLSSTDSFLLCLRAKRLESATDMFLRFSRQNPGASAVTATVKNLIDF